MYFPKTIAVDFDGTLCINAFPEIGGVGEKQKKVIEFIRKAKKYGSTIILWTCREDVDERAYLSEAVAHCKNEDIPIDYINEYPMIQFKGFASRKVCADIYIDDKALNVEDIDELLEMF